MGVLDGRTDFGLAVPPRPLSSQGGIHSTRRRRATGSDLGSDPNSAPTLTASAADTLALHTTVLACAKVHTPTKTYIAQRISDGKDQTRNDALPQAVICPPPLPTSGSCTDDRLTPIGASVGVARLKSSLRCYALDTGSAVYRQHNACDVGRFVREKKSGDRRDLFSFRHTSERHSIEYR